MRSSRKRQSVLYHKICTMVSLVTIRNDAGEYSQQVRFSSRSTPTDSFELYLHVPPLYLPLCAGYPLQSTAALHQLSCCSIQSQADRPRPSVMQHHLPFRLLLSLLLAPQVHGIYLSQLAPGHGSLAGVALQDMCRGLYITGPSCLYDETYKSSFSRYSATVLGFVISHHVWITLLHHYVSGSLVCL